MANRSGNSKAQSNSSVKHKTGESRNGEFTDPFAREFPLGSARQVATDSKEVVIAMGEAADGATEDIFQAFSRFMQIRIAQGDATDDTIRAYYREIDFWVQWCARHNIDPAQARRIHIEMYREEMKQQGLRG